MTGQKQMNVSGERGLAATQLMKPARAVQWAQGGRWLGAGRQSRAAEEACQLRPEILGLVGRRKSSLGRELSLGLHCSGRRGLRVPGRRPTTAGGGGGPEGAQTAGRNSSTWRQAHGVNGGELLSLQAAHRTGVGTWTLGMEAGSSFRNQAQLSLWTSE